MKFFNMVAWGKNFIIRATSWMGIVNLFLIMLTFKKVYEITVPAWLVIFSGMMVVMLVGVVDFFFILRHEFAHNNSRNDMKQDLIQIKNKLDVLESKFPNGLCEKKLKEDSPL